jgi:acyl carrier protein phosphodiesterase
MNYLAHAYLSFNNADWLTGNLISDFVKGKKRFGYTPGIQQGITLHRAIDDYTDRHEITKATKEIFRPAYRLYAGAFVDVVYDHFLANDNQQFENNEALMEFSLKSYASLESNYHLLPAIFYGMLNRMKEQNWLYNYRYLFGMENSFKGLVYRSKYLVESETAFALFTANYDSLKHSYEEFFPGLKLFAQQFIFEHFT